MNEEKIIEETFNFVKQSLNDVWASHDFWHIIRVYNNAIEIWKNEDCNMLIVKLWALLHDIADYKYNNWDENIWPKIAWDFLNSIWVENDIILWVQNIIRYVSFSTNLSDWINFKSKELDIVQDSDKLDSIWAIWIARCMCFAGEKWNEIYNPDIKARLNISKEEYKKSKSTAINHFYEKLLKLKDLMNTKTWKQIAKQRHIFMEEYLKQFFEEIEGRK